MRQKMYEWKFDVLSQDKFLYYKQIVRQYLKVSRLQCKEAAKTDPNEYQSLWLTKPACNPIISYWDATAGLRSLLRVYKLSIRNATRRRLFWMHSARTKSICSGRTLAIDVRLIVWMIDCRSKFTRRFIIYFDFLYLPLWIYPPRMSRT